MDTDLNDCSSVDTVTAVLVADIKVSDEPKAIAEKEPITSNSTENDSINQTNEPNSTIETSPKNSLSSPCKDELEGDDDVIFVERTDEVIELSDEEHSKVAPSLRSYLNTLQLSDKIISDLKRASDDLNSLGRQGHKDRHAIVPIPEATWSIPWKAVSGLFQSPNFNNRMKKRGRPPKSSNKEKSKSGVDKNESANNKRKKYTASVCDESPSKVISIKQEKGTCEMDNRTEDRPISVLQLDPNRPPEFCEVSRSGRLIKKPTRLKDDLIFFKESLNHNRKSLLCRRGDTKTQTEESDHLDSSNSDISIEDHPTIDVSVDGALTAEDELNENSVTSDTCDRWSLEEDSCLDLDDISEKSFASQDNEPNKPSTSSKRNAIGRQDRRIKESQRRRALALCFSNLHEQIITSLNFEPNKTNKLSKINVIENGINMINALRRNLVKLEKEAVKLKVRNCKLKSKLRQMRLDFCSNN